MKNEILVFADIVIDKHKFHYHKNPILVDNLDTDNILITNMISFGKRTYKYFIAYKDGNYKGHCV